MIRVWSPLKWIFLNYFLLSTEEDSNKNDLQDPIDQMENQSTLELTDTKIDSLVVPNIPIFGEFV